jgi:hypothetical protein
MIQESAGQGTLYRTLLCMSKDSRDTPSRFLGDSQLPPYKLGASRI